MKLCPICNFDEPHEHVPDTTKAEYMVVISGWQHYYSTHGESSMQLHPRVTLEEAEKDAETMCKAAQSRVRYAVVKIVKEIENVPGVKWIE